MTRTVCSGAGWVLLNLGMVHKQYALLGRVTPALLLVNAFQVSGDEVMI